jgi:hypothetical protein
MVAALRAMNNARLQMLLEERTEIINGRPGRWHLRFEGRDLLVISDQKRNRMRIMVPIVDDDQLNEADLHLLLSANFDRTLDARYAVAGGYLWSLFLHPLSELTDHLLFDAMRQVKALADSYGSRYASTDLVFTGGE